MTKSVEIFYISDEHGGHFNHHEFLYNGQSILIYDDQDEFITEALIIAEDKKRVDFKYELPLDVLDRQSSLRSLLNNKKYKIYINKVS